MNGRTKRVDGAGLLMQVPRRSGCMGCVLAWPDGRLSHLRDGKTCSSIIGGAPGVGRHPFSLEGADCRHHIWIDSEEPEVPRKLMSKSALVLIGLQDSVPKKKPEPAFVMYAEKKEPAVELVSEKVYRRVGNKLVCLGNLADYKEKEYEPPMETWYATDGPGPADNPWRPTLYRDTKQEQEDTMAFLQVRQKLTLGRKRKIKGESLQSGGQTVVVVIGRQKYLDDI